MLAGPPAGATGDEPALRVMAHSPDAARDRSAASEAAALEVLQLGQGLKGLHVLEVRAQHSDPLVRRVVPTVVGAGGVVHAVVAERRVDEQDAVLREQLVQVGNYSVSPLMRVQPCKRFLPSR